MNKILYVVSAAVVLSMLSSCLGDNIETPDTSQADRIQLGVVLPSSSDSETRAAATVADPDANYQFKLWAAYTGTGGVTIPGETITATASGPTWTTHPWNTDGVNQYFYALHPLSAPSLTVNATDGQSATFTYNVEADAKDQIDLLAAGNGPFYRTLVPLTFKHALSRITFEAKSVEAIKITKIEIGKIFRTGDGKVSVDGSTTEKTKFEWSNRSDKELTTEMDFGSGFSLSAGGSFAKLKSSGATHLDTYESMFLLPHSKTELEGVILKVHIDGETNPRTVDLGDLVYEDADGDPVDGWPQGAWINYKIEISATGINVVFEGGEVQPWETGVEREDTYGYYVLKVSRTKFDFNAIASADCDATNLLIIETTCSTGWTAAFYSDADCTGNPDTNKFELNDGTNHIDSGGSGSAHDTYIVRKTNGNNIGYLKITAGKLNVVIKIEQKI